ncbi:MAG: hypothetical protein Q9N32_08305 [Gammaproteobacteria bacterium]|nr:hypothetical protein [Gammaproteobacteria bacterium]
MQTNLAGSMIMGIKAILIKIAFFVVLGLLAACSSDQRTPYAYITNQLSNDLSVIDTATQEIIYTIPMGNRPVGIALSKNRAFISNSEGQNITVLNTETMTVITHIPAPFWPRWYRLQ